MLIYVELRTNVISNESHDVVISLGDPFQAQPTCLPLHSVGFLFPF